MRSALHRRGLRGGARSFASPGGARARSSPSAVPAVTPPTTGRPRTLCRVLYGFTAHYQLLFRDLPGQGQQLVELMALAPRALSPTEMSARLGMSPAQVSTIARRLLDNGVLRSRQEGRRSWYSLSEPLFRYWLEYRSAPWSQTRVGLIARLLEALGTSTGIRRLRARAAACPLLFPAGEGFSRRVVGAGRAPPPRPAKGRGPPLRGPVLGGVLLSVRRRRLGTALGSAPLRVPA